MGESLIIRKGGGGGGGLNIDGVELTVPYVAFPPELTLSPGDFVSLDVTSGSSYGMSADFLVAANEASNPFSTIIDEGRILMMWKRYIEPGGGGRNTRAMVVRCDGNKFSGPLNQSGDPAFNQQTPLVVETDSVNFADTVQFGHALSSTAHLIVYPQNNATRLTLRMLAVNLSTNAVTTSGSLVGLSNEQFRSCVFISTSVGILLTIDTSNQLVARRISLTSSAVTLGSPTVVHNDFASSASVAWTGNSEKYIVSYKKLNDNSQYYMKVLTVSGSTVTALTEQPFIDADMTLSEARDVNTLIYTNTVNKIIFFYRANNIGQTSTLAGFTYARMITFNDSTNTFVFEKRNHINQKDVRAIRATLSQSNQVLYSWSHGNADVADDNMAYFSTANFDTTTNDIKFGRKINFRSRAIQIPQPIFHASRPTFLYGVSSFNTPFIDNPIHGTVGFSSTFASTGPRVRKSTNNIIGIAKTGGTNLQNVTIIFPKNFV
jgi:hypothetical protein